MSLEVNPKSKKGQASGLGTFIGTVTKPGLDSAKSSDPI